MSARTEARIVAIELRAIGALMLSAALYRRYRGRAAAVKPVASGRARACAAASPERAPPQALSVRRRKALSVRRRKP
jgi:hypothetical protein